MHSLIILDQQEFFIYPCNLTFISRTRVAKLLPIGSHQCFLRYLLIATNFNVIKFAVIACDIKYFNKKSFSSPRSQVVFLCSIWGLIFPLSGIIQQLYFLPKCIGNIAHVPATFHGQITFLLLLVSTCSVISQVPIRVCISLGAILSLIYFFMLEAYSQHFSYYSFIINLTSQGKT